MLEDRAEALLVLLVVLGMHLLGLQARYLRP